MAGLRSYTCSKCGARLNFDGDQDIFGCPFCGAEFNFAEIHREELLSQAKAGLKRSNFETAKEKFSALLSEYPKDFEVLFGLILAEGRISSKDELSDLRKLGGCDFASAIKRADMAAATSNEYEQYFYRLSDLLTTAYEYYKYGGESEANFEKAKKHQKELDNMKIGMHEYGRNGWKVYFSVAAVYMLMVVYPTMFLSPSFSDIEVPFIIEVIILFVILGAMFIWDKYADAFINTYKIGDMEEYRKREVLAAKKRDETSDIYPMMYRELEKADPAADGKSLPKAERVKAKKESDPFIDVTETVTCDKCGGRLMLEQDKNLFVCRSCGVAYGTSLFFGEPLVKARNAMLHDEFEEADQRFCHILMMNPEDLEALLGRILCVGKWRRINDITLSPDDDARTFGELKERAEEAVLHCAEEDKSLFADVQKLTGLYTDFARNGLEQTGAAERFEDLKKDIVREYLKRAGSR